MPTAPLVHPAGTPRFQTVNLVPKEPRAYSETFGRRPTTEEIAEVTAEVGRLEVEGAVSLGGRTDGAPQLRTLFGRFAREGTSDVIILGHSVRGADGGREIVFSNGARAKETDIMTWAAEHGLGCRVVTCYSQSVGLGSPIRLGVARQLIRNAIAEQSARPAETPADGSVRSSSLDRWDGSFSRGRDAAGASDWAVLGSSPAPGGGVMVWESLRRRPAWMGALGWAMVVIGGVANALVMWRIRRQSTQGVGSIEEAADYIRVTFDHWRRGRRATAVLTVIAIVAIGQTVWLVGREAEFDHLQGKEWGETWRWGPAVIGAALTCLATLSCRVDPTTSWVGRVAHGASGGVAGGLTAGALVFLCGAAAAVLVLLWVNLLNLAVYHLNGFGHLGRWARDGALRALLLCVIVSGLGAVYGVVKGALAGYLGLPVFQAIRPRLGSLHSDTSSTPTSPPTVASLSRRETAGAMVAFL
ncbi:MAG TPA: hypothetical protein VD866_30370, partial [Urbifossiella sp.]|nr:hypothetical protein [Urbifossiella sp.]